MSTHTESQNDTKLTYSELDFEKRLWIDTSIQNGELNVSKLSGLCALITKESEHTWRKRYYTWRHRFSSFQDLWYGTYCEYYQKRLIPNLLTRMHTLIEKETDLSKLVRLFEVIESGGKGEQKFIARPLILSEIKPREKGFFSTDKFEYMVVDPKQTGWQQEGSSYAQVS